MSFYTAYGVDNAELAAALLASSCGAQWLQRTVAATRFYGALAVGGENGGDGEHAWAATEVLGG